MKRPTKLITDAFHLVFELLDETPEFIYNTFFIYMNQQNIKRLFFIKTFKKEMTPMTTNKDFIHTDTPVSQVI